MGSRTKRIESLMLQQNGLRAVPSAFLSFNKLKELRIDRNQLENLDNLSGCSSLRMLDVSYNRLTSLEVRDAPISSFSLVATLC